MTSFAYNWYFPIHNRCTKCIFNGLQKHLGDAGIQSGIHYPIPIHMQDAYAELPYSEGDFPETEGYAKKILSLPIYPEITDEMIDYVAAKVAEFTG